MRRNFLLQLTCSVLLLAVLPNVLQACGGSSNSNGGRAQSGGTGASDQGGATAAAGAGGTANAQGGMGGQVEDTVIFVPGAEVATVAGGPTDGSTDGPIADALFSNPANLVLSGQTIYVADYDNEAVRVIHLDSGTVSTLGQAATFCRPFGLAVGSANGLFVGTGCDAQGSATTTAGAIWNFDTSTTNPPNLAFSSNGRPRGLVYLPADTDHAQGRLAFSDLNGHTIQVFDFASNVVTVLAGSQGNAGFADGVGTAARFDGPYGMAALGNDLVVCDYNSHVLRLVTLDGTVTTLAGTPMAAGMVDGPVAASRFTNPQGVAVDAQGNLFISDWGNQRIRVIHAGVVRTLAGNGVAGFADGTGDSASFFGQEGLAVTADGTTVYVADGNAGNSGPYRRVRAIAVPPLE